VKTKSQKSWSGSAGSAATAHPRSAWYTSGTENASSVAIRRYRPGQVHARCLELAHALTAATARTASTIFDSSGRTYSSIGLL
jgi:hypothetical protein